MNGRVTSVSADLMRTPNTWLNGLMITSAAVLVVSVTWAALAEIDEVVRGTGVVITSRSMQVVQHLEGGILAELLIEEGDQVEEGQVIMRIDDTGLAARLREDTQRYYSLVGTLARLIAEIEGGNIILPDSVLEGREDILRREEELYASHQSQLQNSLAILGQQVAQRRQERAGYLQQYRSLGESIRIAEQEQEMIEESYYMGAVSQMQVLQKRREINDLVSQYNSARTAYQQTEAALAEAQERVLEKRQSFESEVLGQRNEIQAEVSVLEETIIAALDRVARTEVRSPIKGTINTVHIKTIGGVVTPGMDLIDIVPEQNSLLIEALIPPKDRGFLVPGQITNVKITAYDFAIWGSLEGQVENISADTTTDERGNTFYHVRVRTDETVLTKGDQEKHVMVGMEAQVDVLTGKRTVLNYLLKPLHRAMDNALSER